MQEPSLIFEDKQLLVLEKPPGFLAQPENQKRPDIFTWAKSYLKEKWNKPGQVYLGIVQRLDLPVGGVIVFAKSSKAASRLAKQFRERTITKKYLSVCLGEPQASEGTFEDYLVRVGNKTILSEIKDQGTKAFLKWKVIKVLRSGEDNPISLIKIDLLTGVKHQIRAQFSSY
ncbi:MAG: RNA pseudouridine synthase, partial [Deltaproteobacteria bacterium]|nr:RNA pseudouridine synthase [Deltaproteobacteria bacterium]